MSASNAPALRAIAQQLLALLESYEQEVGRMVTHWPDAKHYVEVNRQMNQIRDLGGALAGLHAAWAEVLIAHADLIRALLNAGDAVDAGQLAPERRRHALATQQLRARVQWLLPCEEDGAS
ncbi:hypothetical protein H8N03_24605 [Ramlibacter sp. USB13]|uniref:Uncharacterized protein n=1 Tax=Ramlibacter cellulosilyticus TaxID=2764187 RepID=A0A923MVP4_9BURK|nr:hypothetical protein [Ramlibacter cellulosilyticus]MBC5786143.1 hypothetical protein [Ramlibacter cellulosilyticus]